MKTKLSPPLTVVDKSGDIGQPGEEGCEDDDKDLPDVEPGPAKDPLHVNAVPRPVPAFEPDSTIPHYQNTPPGPAPEQRAGGVALEGSEYEVKTTLHPAFMSQKDHQSIINVHHDHSYAITDPKKLKRDLDEAKEKVEDLQKELVNERKKVKRMKKKIEDLTTVTSELKEKNLISSSVEELLGNSFSGCSKELLERVVEGKSKTYPEELEFCYDSSVLFIKSL